MKRHGNLFSQVTDMENLLAALGKACKGKSSQRRVQRVLQRRDEYLKKLQESLLDGTYRTSGYKTKTIYEPKRREIYVLPFWPDRVAQHAVMNVVAPIWENLFIADSYACRQGKGQHAGSKRCMEFVRKSRYCLQCDIRKFYPSIHHETLKAIIARKIKDKGVLWLLGEIIDSVPGERNVPIGNYTSQWFGNLYLNEIDQLLKHKHHVRDYLRYADDFLLFDDDKGKLRELASVIETYAADRLKLALSKCNLYPVSRGVDFLGYRHFPTGKILVRKSTAKRMKKRLAAIPRQVTRGELTREAALSSVCSTKGWLKWANAHHLALALEVEKLETWLRIEGELPRYDAWKASA